MEAKEIWLNILIFNIKITIVLVVNLLSDPIFCINF